MELPHVLESNLHQVYLAAIRLDRYPVTGGSEMLGFVLRRASPLYYSPTRQAMLIRHDHASSTAPGIFRIYTRILYPSPTTGYITSCFIITCTIIAIYILSLSSGEVHLHLDQGHLHTTPLSQGKTEPVPCSADHNGHGHMTITLTNHVNVML